MVFGGCVPAGWETCDIEYRECPTDGDIDVVTDEEADEEAGDDIADCASFGGDTDACETTEGCRVLSGRVPVEDDGEYCVDYDRPLKPVACTETDEICTYAMSFAKPAGGADSLCMLFSSCTPAGWETCDIAYSECPTEAIEPVPIDIPSASF